jgi:riboflavin biosynthesis pyrimidine reductase
VEISLDLIYSNSAISLDGRLGTADHERVMLGSREDLWRMSRLRARADAVLVGGQTFRTWAIPLVEDPAVAESDRSRPMINAVLTRSGEGPRSGRFYEDAATRPVILGGPGADLDGHAEGTGVHRAEGESTVAWAVQILQQVYGVRRLLVEGGGGLLAPLLRAGLLDELYVTLCPRLVGQPGAPSLTDGLGFGGAARRLELVSCEPAGDEVFLRYRVVGKTGEPGLSRP